MSQHTANKETDNRASMTLAFASPHASWRVSRMTSWPLRSVERETANAQEGAFIVSTAERRNPVKACPRACHEKLSLVDEADARTRCCAGPVSGLFCNSGDAVPLDGAAPQHRGITIETLYGEASHLLPRHEPRGGWNERSDTIPTALNDL